jgi:predicted O-methyltransferase YrrM
VQRWRTQALEASDRLAGRVARAAANTRQSEADVDLAIAAVLRERGVRDLNDVAGFVAFLRASWEPLTVDVAALSPGEDLLLDSLLEHFRSGVTALPVSLTVEVAEHADRLLASREPYDRSALLTDVGTHARWSSSFGHSARILTAVVRYLRCRNVVEIGTAYGLGTLFLADALSRGHEPGRLATVEAAEPQRRLSAELLAGVATTFHGRTPEVLSEVFQTVGPVDLLFHDGDHSRDAYVADFEAALPQLVPGAVVVFDDIRWEDPFRRRDARTAEGWDLVSSHPRVRRKVELDGRYGLLLLS